MECLICQCDLGVAAFVAPNATSVDCEDGPAFRLKCGHAYHTNCLCRALRLDAACPMCRNTQPVEDNSIRMTMRDGVIEFSLGMEAYEEVVYDAVGPQAPDSIGARFLETFDETQKDPRVQRARAAVNKAKKYYRQVEASIMRARASALSDTLAQFRRVHQRNFEEARRGLRRALHKLKACESVPIEAALGPEVRKYIEPYTVDFWVGNNDFGPLKRSFWCR